MGTSIYKNNQSFPFNKLCTLIEKALGYFSTWPPTATIILGNIGILEDGAFIHVGYFDKILEVGDIRKIVTPNSDVMYSLLGSVAINQGRRGEDSSLLTESVTRTKFVTVEFGRANALVLRAAGCVEAHFSDFALLADAILACHSNGERKSNWVLVTHVVIADETTIFISRKAGGMLQLMIGPDDVPDVSMFADSDVIAEKDIAFKVIASKGCTPLFRVAQVKRRFLGRAGFTMV